MYLGGRCEDIQMYLCRLLTLCRPFCDQLKMPSDHWNPAPPVPDSKQRADQAGNVQVKLDSPLLHSDSAIRQHPTRAGNLAAVRNLLISPPFPPLLPTSSFSPPQLVSRFRVSLEVVSL